MILVFQYYKLEMNQANECADDSDDEDIEAKDLNEELKYEFPSFF